MIANVPDYINCRCRTDQQPLTKSLHCKL